MTPDKLGPTAIVIYVCDLCGQSDVVSGPRYGMESRQRKKLLGFPAWVGCGFNGCPSRKHPHHVLAGDSAMFAELVLGWKSYLSTHKIESLRREDVEWMDGGLATPAWLEARQAVGLHG